MRISDWSSDVCSSDLGATVVVASRTLASVEQVVEEIKAGGGKAIGIACDMGHAAQIRHMVAETAQKLGGVEIHVNNAQGFGTRETPMRANPPTPLETFSEAEWDWVFDTGLKGTLTDIQEVFQTIKA